MGYVGQILIHKQMHSDIRDIPPGNGSRSIPQRSGTDRRKVLSTKPVSIVMWQRIKDLPVEVAGSHVAFLSVRDIVQLERAVVTESERGALFLMVRSGPALDLILRLSDETMCTWLCKNVIKVKCFSLTALAEKKSSDLHLRFETAQFIHVKKSAPEFPADPCLCDKVNNMFLRGDMSCTSNEPTPGQRFHHLRQLNITADSLLHPWASELLLANPGLQSLQLSLPCNQLPSFWFDDAARLCGKLQELDLYGLRSGTDVTDDGALWSIAAHCSSLRTLTLRGRHAAAESALGEEPMIAITLQCKQLEKVCVTTSILAAPAVTAMCLNCRNLTSLRLPNASIPQADLLHLLPQHRKRPIAELECRWALRQESEVQACAALFSGLRTLTVTLAEESECAVAAGVLHMHSVHSLTIKLVHGTTTGAGEVLRAVAQTCTQLRHFAYSGDLVDMDAFPSIIAQNRYLTACTSNSREDSDRILHALALHSPLLQSVTVSNVSDSAVIALAIACTHLRGLQIKSAGITDAALAAISTCCREFEGLCIEHCPNITEAGLTSLVAACSQQLYCLDVKHPAIDLAAAERIRGRRDPSEFCVLWS